MASIRRATGVAVTYTRGASSKSVTATLGVSDWNVTDAQGLMLRVETRDFLIQASDLSGTFGDPQRGDTIAFSGWLYEVHPAGPDLPLFQHSGSVKNQLRIHTKQIGPG